MSALRTAPALALTLALASCATVPAPPPAGPASGPAPPHAAPPSAPPAPAGPLRLAGEPAIEVGLAWDLDSLTLSPVTRAELALRRQRPGTADAVVAFRAPLTARRDNGKVAASWGAQGSFELRLGDTLWVATTSGEERFGWRGRSWHGQAKLFLNSRGKLTLATRVPLETYLLGVVPGEIGGLTEAVIEAGRAQAVAARSYTLFYRGRRAGEGFDLYGTVEDQVFGSIETERPLATRCVTDTRGRLALSDGQPIRANYCSTCGGITAEVWEAWPAEALPYLTSHLDRGSADWCAASPHYRWREEWTASDFLATLARWAPMQGVAMPPGGPGDLVDVRVDARSRSGRVWRLVVSTTTGNVVLPAYAIRASLRRPGAPGAILRSTLFKVDVRRDPATHRALAVVVSGAGSGHGVGLCQTGALGMARAGLDAKAILLHYYPGVELKTLY